MLFCYYKNTKSEILIIVLPKNLVDMIEMSYWHVQVTKQTDRPRYKVVPTWQKKITWFLMRWHPRTQLGWFSVANLMVFFYNYSTIFVSNLRIFYPKNISSNYRDCYTTYVFYSRVICHPVGSSQRVLNISVANTLQQIIF